MGVALSLGWGQTISTWKIIALVASSCAIYCAGMAANDLFDARVDAIERPQRPIPSGRVTLKTAWLIVLGLQGIGLALAIAVGWAALFAVTATILATYAYNAKLKHGPAGPIAMGACRYGNAVIGLSAGGLPPLAVLPYLVPIGTWIYVAGLTTLSRYEVDGAPRSRVLRAVMIITFATMLAALWAPVSALPERSGVIWLLLPLAVLFRPLWNAVKYVDPPSIRRAVLAGIFGIPLVDALVAAQAGAWGLAAITAGILVPGIWFGRWFYAT